MRWPSPRNAILAATFALLAVSQISVRSIPFLRPFAIDLANLHAFHSCTRTFTGTKLAVRDAPYAVPGTVCGDPTGRAMFYPPLLYWSFAWLRLVPFSAASLIWAAAIAAAMALLPFAWLSAEERRRSKVALVAFWALLLVQFPVAFAIERGNSDVVVVVAWTAALVLWRKERRFAAGLVSAAAVALKLYPAFAVAALGLGLLLGCRKHLARYAAGLAVGGAAAVALVPRQTWIYFKHVLPVFAAQRPEQQIYSHSVPMIAGAGVAALLGALLLASWGVFAARRIAIDPRLPFAGALAISTYFAGTSFDYNLVTCYPLLLLLFVEVERRAALDDGLLLLGGLVALVADRSFFERAPNLHVALQVGWLALVPLVGIARSLSARAAPAGAPPADAPAPARGLAPPPAPLAPWIALSMALALALAFGLARPGWAPRGIRFETVFWVLFRGDLPAAVLGLAIACAALAWAGRLPPRVVSWVDALGRRPQAAIAGFALVAAGASLLAYRAYPLSMDEYAPWFQAQVFAAGKLTGQVPPELIPRLVPQLRDYFLEVAKDGRMISAYWPGFALLLTPFMRLGVPWLLNPLIGAASLALLWHLSRRLLPERAHGWVLLFALASPAFLVNAISFYSMSAHLLFSLLFVALLLDEPGPGRTALAGMVGSVALVLHNPFPHALFAAPWIVWIARHPRRRHLWALLLGYLPLGLLLLGGWSQLRAQVASASPAGPTQPTPLPALALHMLQLAFALPGPASLWARLAGFTKLVVWASPGLVALACAGTALVLRDPRPERTPLRLLALSGLLTLGAYVLVPWDQGHGWGYRYFHSAWGVLPLLAAVPLLEPGPDRERAARAMVAAALASLLLATPLRLVQVGAFIGRHLRQIPDAATAGTSVVFVRPWRGYYTIDMVHNDPFLEGDRWMLYSRGDAEDARLAHALSPDARVAASNDVATIWEIPPRR